MADGFELMVELRETVDCSLASIAEWKRLQDEANDRERDYRRIKSVAYLRARAQKVPVTIISAVVDGQNDVNEAWHAMACAKSASDTEHEFFLMKKKQAGVLQDAVAIERQRARMM